MYYKLFINWTNEGVKGEKWEEGDDEYCEGREGWGLQRLSLMITIETFTERNLFDFRYIKPFDRSYIDQVFLSFSINLIHTHIPHIPTHSLIPSLPQAGPMVLFATPGMLHAGLSLQVSSLPPQSPSLFLSFSLSLLVLSFFFLSLFVMLSLFLGIQEVGSKSPQYGHTSWILRGRHSGTPPIEGSLSLSLSLSLILSLSLLISPYSCDYFFKEENTQKKLKSKKSLSLFLSSLSVFSLLSLFTSLQPPLFPSYLSHLSLLSSRAASLMFCAKSNTFPSLHTRTPRESCRQCLLCLSLSQYLCFFFALPQSVIIL